MIVHDSEIMVTLVMSRGSVPSVECSHGDQHSHHQRNNNHKYSSNFKDFN